jgi:hypothetical protein
MTRSTFLIAAASVVLAAGASAQQKYPAVLDGHAILPALTLVAPPADAPPDLALSGRYAGPPGQRVDTPESVPGISALSGRSIRQPSAGHAIR